MNVSYAAEVTLLFHSCGGPHESQFYHSAWWFLRLHWKEHSKFLKCSILTDLHVLKYWWTVSPCLFELFLPQYGLGLLANRAILCIPPLPCHNTTDWLKRIKKEINYFNKAHLSIEMHFRNMVERMPRVCKAVRAKGGYLKNLKC